MNTILNEILCSSNANTCIQYHLEKRHQNGKLQSIIISDFLHNNPGIQHDMFEVCGDLCIHPSTPPWKAGKKGIVLTSDSPRGNRPQLNIERPSYLRQSFSKTISETKTKRMCYTAGTGSGVISQGTPKRHLVYRSFTPAMHRLSDAVMIELTKHFKNDPDVDISDITNMELLGYFDRKGIRFHRDQRYNRSGDFLSHLNSQKKNTATMILVVGDERELEFQLFRRKKKGEQCEGHVKVNGAGSCVVFTMKHGSLFLLHHKDEKDMFRTAFSEEFRTFFMHKSKGLLKKERDGISFSLVFRCCVHMKQVWKKTGLLVLTEQDTTEDKGRWDKFGNDKYLRKYIDGNSVHKRTKNKKDREDERMRSMFFKMKRKYLNNN